MTNIPIRGVGDVGLVTDLEPQDLPLKAWTNCRNVRFSDGILSRFSIFKQIKAGYTYAKTPSGVYDSSSEYGEGRIVTVFTDGSIEELFNGTVTDVTNTGTLITTSLKPTDCFLGGVHYINKPLSTPVYRQSGSSGAYVEIPGWSADDTCSSLRSFKDFLIALNVTKSGTHYPGMVKWSDATQAGAPPSNWDTVNTASLAGENVINSLKGGLIDGLPLGDSFIVYGEQQAYRMDYINTPFIFSTETLFSDVGMIAKNCAVGVNGKHYVFGSNDIYVHDGMQKQSIANGRVIKQVFGEIDFGKRNRCIVLHDDYHHEIYFCYPSVDDGAAWPLAQVDGCNRAAVFNYKFNTWTVIDLPSIVSSVNTTISSTMSWDTSPNWDNGGQTWASLEGQKPRNILVCGTGNSTLGKAAQSYFMDDIYNGRLGNPVDYDVFWDAYAETVYKDLDDIGAELIGRKMIRRIVPQIKTPDPTTTITFTVGQAETLSQDILWGRGLTMTPWTDLKYDTRITGRYIALRMNIPSGSYAEMSGYDADVVAISRR
ncbi:MAG: hypothetical protein IE937_01085 [Gammaproteobacteria bacterium]|nr:hypothetical protein [Gammaproteobacteria bacterium]